MISLAMKRQKRLWHLLLWLVVLLTSGAVRTQSSPANAVGPAATSQAKPDMKFFYMDGNGSYKYAFDTGRGLEGEQSADQTNEVKGYYTYYEKGVPYMVKYRSGVQGFQPQVVTTSNAQAGAKPLLAQILQNTEQARANPLTAAITMTATAQASPITRLGSNLQSSLKFVQDAVQTMRTQPIQLSFHSLHGHLQHATTSSLQQAQAAAHAPSRTPAAPATPSSPLAPVRQAELQQINAMAATAQELPKQPYTFSYLGEQSSRSESADKQGNVMGKYSYRDEAGFHDLTYKAGDDTGFVILGGSLSKSHAANLASGAPFSTAATKAAATNAAAAANANTATDIATTNTIAINTATRAVAQAPQVAAPVAALPTAIAVAPAHPPSELVVNVSQLPPFASYNYKVSPLGVARIGIAANIISSADDEGKILRKLGRFAK